MYGWSNICSDPSGCCETQVSVLQNKKLQHKYFFHAVMKCSWYLPLTHLKYIINKSLILKVFQSRLLMCVLLA